MPWLNNKKVNALWANHQSANAWGWIDGAWRKFHDDHHEAVTNFAILASHAKADNRDVSVRVDGNRVKEMYVW